MANSNENQLARTEKTATPLTVAKRSEFCKGTIACLTLTASMLKTEVTTPQQLIWTQMLEPYPLPLIQKAFQLHMKRSNFFPTPHEIIESIETLQREERERLAEQQRKDEKRRTEEARERGETWGLADVINKFRHILSTSAQKALREGKPMPAAPIASVGDETVLITPEKRARARAQAAEALRRFGKSNPRAEQSDSKEAHV